MIKPQQFAILVLSGLALLAAGVFATETRLLLYWPAIGLFGLTAVLIPLAGRWPLTTTPSAGCLISCLVLAWYMAGRSWLSPVTLYAKEDLLLILGCYVTYLSSATFFSNPGSRRCWLFILAAVSIINLGVAYFHLTGKSSFHLIPGFSRVFGDGQRIGGLYNNPNHLAAWLSGSGILFATLIFSRTHLLLRFAYAILAVFSVIILAYTQSRGGIIGCIIGISAIGIMTLIWGVKALRVTFTGAVIGFFSVTCLMALLAIGIFSPSLFSRVNSFSPVSVTEDARSYIWQAALSQAKNPQNNPTLGSGARMFYEGCITYRTEDTPPTLDDALFVHNDWLQLWLEYGWLGLGLTFIVLCLHLGNGWRRSFNRSTVHFSPFPSLTIGCIGGLLAVLAHAFFDFHLHVPSIALLSSGFLGVLANPPHSTTSKKLVQVPGLRAFLKLTALIFGAMMIHGTYISGRADYHAFRAQQIMSGTPSSGSFSRGLVELNQAIALDHHNFLYFYDRGLLRIESLPLLSNAARAEQLEAARVDLEKAQRLNPFHMYIPLALADVYDATGEQKLALKSIEEAIRLAPTSMAPRLSLAIHFHRYQQWDKAEQAYQSALKATAHTNMDAFDLYQVFKKDSQRLNENK